MPAYENLGEKEEWLNRPPRVEMEHIQLANEPNLVVYFVIALSLAALAALIIWKVKK